MAFGKNDPRTLDECTASVRDMLAQLDPKRVTVQDEYWLIDGLRTTRAGLGAGHPESQALADEAEAGYDVSSIAPVAKPAPDLMGALKESLPKLGAAVSARTCTGGCGTLCTKDNADRNDDGSWLCGSCAVSGASAPKAGA